MNTKEEIAVKMILAAWQSQQESINKTLSVLSDEDLNAEVATGKNKAIWIVGHLAVVNDRLFSILELGEKIGSNYEEYFYNGETKTEVPSADGARKYWENTSTLLNKKIANFTTNDWFQKHALVSAEDFAKEPHRNKLNVLINRTNHMAHHGGQLAFLVKKWLKEKVI